MKQQIKDILAKTVKFLKDPTNKAAEIAKKAEYEARIKQTAEDAMNDLRSIPQMQNILANLPKNLQYGIGEFGFSARQCKIILDTTVKKFDFLRGFAELLLLANQEQLGLTPNNLHNASLKEYYHVAKIIKIEALLLSVIVETALLTKPEFKNYKPSVDAYIYQSKLQEANGDEKRAIYKFIMAYWTNSIKECVNEAVFEQNISSWYKWLVFNNGYGYSYYDYEQGKTTTTKDLKPADAIQAHLERLGIKDVADYEFFLNDEHYDALIRKNELKRGYYNDLRNADEILKDRKYDVTSFKEACYDSPTLQDAKLMLSFDECQPNKPDLSKVFTNCKQR